MPFLPRDFVIPEPPSTDEFMLTPLRVDHLVLDYEAVMSSREHLWQLFGPGWGWPPADMTLMQDLVDLGWHQKEFQLRRSFNWAVMSPDQRMLLGCCYLDPSDTPGFDAEGYYWARSDRIAGPSVRPAQAPAADAAGGLRAGRLRAHARCDQHPQRRRRGPPWRGSVFGARPHPHRR